VSGCELKETEISAALGSVRSSRFFSLHACIMECSDAEKTEVTAPSKAETQSENKQQTTSSAPRKTSLARSSPKRDRRKSRFFCRITSAFFELKL